jgi:hypothetical protein
MTAFKIIYTFIDGKGANDEELPTTMELGAVIELKSGEKYQITGHEFDSKQASLNITCEKVSDGVPT